MENVIGRRDFLKFGTAMAAGLSMGMIPTGCAENARSDDAESFSSLKYSFLIDPNNFSRINSETKIIESVSPIVSYGSDTKEIHRTIIFDPYLIEKASLAKEVISCSDSEKSVASTVPIDSFSTTLASTLGVQVIGFSEMIDVAADSISSILQHGKFDLGVDFFHSDMQVAFSENQIVNPNDSIVVFDMMKQVGKRIDLDLFGWKFQIRGPESHTLGSCVKSKVNHINFEIQRSIGNGRYSYVANFHIGAYKSGKKRCFVLWNNEKPYNICWKTCDSNKKTLTEMMKWVIIAVAAAIGLYISAFIIAAIAEALAVALLPVLAVLAI